MSSDIPVASAPMSSLNKVFTPSNLSSTVQYVVWLLPMVSRNAVSECVYSVVVVTFAKIAMHHANVENPKRYFVGLYKLYNSFCPLDCPSNIFIYTTSKANQRIMVFY